MAKRKRRSKFTWFPVQHTVTPTAEDRLWGIANSIAVDRAGEIVTGVIPLTYDAPGELGAFDVNDPGVLAGIVGQEYFLRRVVGKFHAALQPQGNATDGVPNATQVSLRDASSPQAFSLPELMEVVRQISTSPSEPTTQTSSSGTTVPSRKTRLESRGFGVGLGPRQRRPRALLGTKCPHQVSPRSNKSRRRSRGPRGTTEASPTDPTSTQKPLDESLRTSDSGSRSRQSCTPPVQTKQPRTDSYAFRLPNRIRRSPASPQPRSILTTSRSKHGLSRVTFRRKRHPLRVPLPPKVFFVREQCLTGGPQMGTRKGKGNGGEEAHPTRRCTLWLVT